MDIQLKTDHKPAVWNTNIKKKSEKQSLKQSFITTEQ